MSPEFKPFRPRVSEVDSSILEFGHVNRYIMENRMAHSVDPDVTAWYKPSHLDLYCLHRCLTWSAGLKGCSHFASS